RRNANPLQGSLSVVFCAFLKHSPYSHRTQMHDSRNSSTIFNGMIAMMSCQRQSEILPDPPGRRRLAKDGAIRHDLEITAAITRAALYWTDRWAALGTNLPDIDYDLRLFS